MKLKNVASLVLAGVMAVSMLAGCQNTSVNPEPTPNPDPTPATGYSAKLGKEIDELSPIAGNNVGWSEKSNLQSSLNYQVGSVGYNALTGSFLDSLNDGQVQFVDSFWNTPAIVTNVNDEVTTDMDANVNARRNPSASNAVMSLNPNSTNYDVDEYNTVLLFVVDNGVNLNNAMDQIAKEIVYGVENLDDDYDSTPLSSGNSMNVDYEYTGSVATCTKTFEAGHGVGVSFIAVEIVRHIV